MIELTSIISGILMLKATIFGYNLKKLFACLFEVATFCMFLIISVYLMGTLLDAFSLPVANRRDVYTPFFVFGIRVE